MKQYLKNLFTRPTAEKRKAPPPTANAATYWKSRYYEAAKETRQNSNYWTNAGDLDPDGTISRDIVKLRNRARHITRNSSYAKGMMETLVQDVVGTGPVLDIDTQTSADRPIIDDWDDWSLAADIAGVSDLAELLQTTVRGFVETGEAIFIKTNAVRPAGGSRLRLQSIEPDRLATPWERLADPSIDMGVEKKENGEPVAYWINDVHPGAIDKIAGGRTADNFSRVPADQVLHLFRRDRPGQSRGVTWIASALDLYAKQHRFTHATILAAETAASMAAVLESDIGLGSPVDPDDQAADYEIEYDTLVTLPSGYKLSQLRAEHPATTMDMFMKLILSEMARCLNMPLNIAMANSSSHNFASGRLDHQIYYKFIGVIRRSLETHLLAPVFGNWFGERNLAGSPIIARVRPVWYWPGPAVAIDPKKDAEADAINLQNETINRTEICARRGVRHLAVKEKLDFENETAAPPPGIQNNENEPDENEPTDAADVAAA